MELDVFNRIRWISNGLTEIGFFGFGFQWKKKLIDTRKLDFRFWFFQGLDTMFCLDVFWFFGYWCSSDTGYWIIAYQSTSDTKVVAATLPDNCRTAKLLVQVFTKT
jgi:hypothetical protein